MLLSIITINLNNKTGLKKTFDSVFQQTYTDFEYIVVDGASTDNSTGLIIQNANQLTYWVSEPDKGIYNAMNKGIAKASGKYLLFLNSGDWLCNDNSLYKAKKILEQPNADIYYCDVNFLDEKKQIAWQKNYPQKITLDFLLKSSLCHQAMFIKKEVFEQVGNYREEYRLSADWSHYFEAYKKGYSFQKLKDVRLSNFSLNGFSIDYLLSNSERKDFIAKCYPEHLASHNEITKPKKLVEKALIKGKQLLKLTQIRQQRRYYQHIVSHLN